MVYMYYGADCHLSLCLDLLEAHRLSTQAAYVRKYSSVDSVETLPSHEGITHVVHCGTCGRSTGSAEIPTDQGKFWWCKRGKRYAKECAVW